MKLMVFSDVHGNLPALRKALEQCPEANGFICLGDVVGYGPWSDECMDVIARLDNCVLLEGNHEHDYLSGAYSGTNAVARAFFEFTHPRFHRYAQIGGLRKKHVLDKYTFTHTLFDKNIYADTRIDLDGNYFIGHSHQQFEMRQNEFVLFNTGSVGQNRTYINVINYLIYDSDSHGVEKRSICYDVDEVIQEMTCQGYPVICIDYYRTKPRLIR